MSTIAEQHAVGTSTVDRRAEFARELDTAQSALASVQSARRRALSGALLAAAALAFGLFWFAKSPQALPALLTALGGAGAVVAMRRYIRSGDVWTRLAVRIEGLEGALARISNRWQGKGRSGAEFSRAGHLYQDDLKILGEGSLFELLSTTRTEVGAARLADYLLRPAGIAEARRRQEAVRELAGATALRESVQALGKARFQDCDQGDFAEWLAAPRICAPRAIQRIMLASSILALVSGLGTLVRIFALSHALPWFVLALLVLWICTAFYIRRVRSQLRRLLLISGPLSVLQQGVALLERQQFSSQKLRVCVETLQSQHASRALHRLERLTHWVDLRERTELYAVARILATGTQLVLEAERWRAMHGTRLLEWLQCWAEFEALNVLGRYAYEHPENTFPQLTDGEAAFEASEMKHPLLPADTSVGNNIVLGGKDETRMLVISGANMAGKSTLLRAIGLNAVLAMAGAPVCASYAWMSALAVCASIAVADSLADGRSRFLAEVERVKATLDAARANGSQNDAEAGPVLFLIDEILSGTNSADRKVAAAHMVHALLAAGAIGALSTHDLALNALAEEDTMGIRLVHMASISADRPLDFDYRLRPGSSRETNALAIVAMMGIEIKNGE
ncbi:MutS-related protein [Silvibacterium sp.]|uniref:MutS-related protein n=1 Tax=Silvibacterium sp. TaxID=1964179 RepID=UPI0039E63657